MSESLRILILEDNPNDPELIQFELQEAGTVFTSKVVITEKDNVHELQERFPYLIHSDYDLPAYNGAMRLAKAGRRCPDTPFIVITGTVSEDRAIGRSGQGGNFLFFTGARAEFISRKDNQIPKMAISSNSWVNPESEL